MSLLDKLEKLFRFHKQNKILDKAEARTTEYKEHYINGDLVQTDILIDGESVAESLNAKKKYLDAASSDARKKREKIIAKAEKRHQPLSKGEIMVLRKEEEKKRLEAAKMVASMYRREH